MSESFFLFFTLHPLRIKPLFSSFRRSLRAWNDNPEVAIVKECSYRQQFHHLRKEITQVTRDPKIRKSLMSFAVTFAITFVIPFTVRFAIPPLRSGLKDLILTLEVSEPIKMVYQNHVLTREGMTSLAGALTIVKKKGIVSYCSCSSKLVSMSIFTSRIR